MANSTAPAQDDYVLDHRHSPHAHLRGVPISAVRLTDSFWEPRRARNRERTIPKQYEQCELTGRVDNFRVASGRKSGAFRGIYFNDSDVYKWLESAAYTLGTDPTPQLRATVRAVVEEIAAAQQPDGYLNTYFMGERAKDRFTNLRDMHELYCAGHLIQAAVAHHRALGEPELLGIARKLADHICDAFGPAAEGKRETADGHEEIELALVELYRLTRHERYLRQAQFFIDVRGRGKVGGTAYFQDHQPVREMSRVTGHAVRAMYLAAGAADVLAETGEPALRAALERQWANMTTTQLYLTGGVGSRYEGEAFGRDYELPSERAYTETCAAIGSVMWSQRMLALDGDPRYADLIELTLYNAVIAGIALDGEKYFYQNPLADDGTHRRQSWFDCACCPPNLSRLLAYLPALFYSTRGDDELFVHLYADGTAGVPLGGRQVNVTQQTRYPWDGRITLRVDTDGVFAIHLRVPGWCESATLVLNGQPADTRVQPGTYATIRRRWTNGDLVTLDLAMPTRFVASHPYAAENRDRVALMRGPLVYCLESVDHPGVDLRDVRLDPSSELQPVDRPDLLGGVVVLEGSGISASPHARWQGRLYCPATADAPVAQLNTVPLRAVPYYVWANREPGRMQIWFPHA